MTPLAVSHPELSAYIEGLYAAEDALLLELRREMESRGLPEIQVSPEVGRLLQVLLIGTGAERVLEIGTLGGYSALWMARALPPTGQLITLEVEEERAALAREYAGRGGLEEVIEVRVGRASDLLPVIEAEEESFDAVFIDADKESYPLYLEHARRMLRVGGLLFADNTLWGGSVLDPASGDEGAEALRRFNWEMASAPELEATLLPIRDGLTVAVKVA